MESDRILNLVLLFSSLLSICSTDEFVRQVGEEVTLSCPVHVEGCGKYLAVQFYHGSSRVYMYSPVIGINSPAGKLVDRCFDVTQAHLGADCLRGSLDVSDESAELTISPIFDEDDGDYSCKVSYFKATADCPATHSSKLRIIAPPSSSRIYTSADPGDDVTGQDVGPLAVGSQLEVTCEAVGSKPGAEIVWFWSSDPDNHVEGELTTVEENDGTYTTTNVLRVEVDEDLSGETLQCRIDHEALEESIIKSLGNILVNVAVSSVVLVEESLVGREDEEITIICIAGQSRPAADISWSIEEVSEDSFDQIDEIIDLENGTFETKSQIVIAATVDLHLKNVTCEAINEVMLEPINTTEFLDIHYSPRTVVSPENITVITNESVELECIIDANPMNVTNVEWKRDDQLIYNSESFNASDYEIFEESDVESMSDDSHSNTILLANIQQHHEGTYTCHATNEIGESFSHLSASIDVLFPPTTSLEISENIIKEDDVMNITMTCSIVDGDPPVFSKVSWFLDDDLVKVCDDSEEEELVISDEESMESWDYISCDEENMNVVTLLTADRSFSGNWSCAGESIAGLGQPSSSEHLDVLYVPDEAEILEDNDSPSKHDNITLTCSVDDFGNPDHVSFIWTRKGDVIEDEKEDILVLENLGVVDRGEYSCQAENEVGRGEVGVYNLEINAPLNFLVELNEVYTFLDTEPEDLECKVECVRNSDTLCKVKWWINGEVVPEDDPKYEIVDDVIPADPEKDVFESVHSKFSWNLENIPGQHINHENQNFTVSCKASFESENTLEIASSSTVFVEYPPEFVEISEETIVVTEGDEGTSIVCSSNANPEPSISWTFEDEVISEGPVLTFPEIFERSQSGKYICKSENKHGEKDAFLDLDVQYIPECSLTYEIESSENILVITCSVDANPEDLIFAWSKDETETFEGQSNSETPLVSVARINLGNETHGNYSCQVSNRVGEAEACVLTIPGNFMEKLVDEEDYRTIIIIAAIVGFFVLLCIASLIFNCRKHRISKGATRDRDTPPPLAPIFLTETDHGKLPFNNFKRPPQKVLLQSPDDDMDYADLQFKKGSAILDFFKEKPAKIDKETKDLEYLKELSKL